MIKSRKLANTKMKWGSLLGWCDQVLLPTIDEGYDLHSTPCFTTRVSCLVSSTRTPSFWFVFIVKRNRQHMGMIIECLKELGNGGRGGGGRSDWCRLLLGELGNLFFQVTCVNDWRKNIYYFHIFPSLDSPSRRQHAIYRHSEHVRQSSLSASV